MVDDVVTSNKMRRKVCAGYFAWKLNLSGVFKEKTRREKITAESLPSADHSNVP
jgi:hypothetical protein